MKLIVGTESTWSLRAAICGYLSGIQISFEVIDLANKDYKEKISLYSEAGLVPILDTGTVKVHDSLAIAEYFNELSNGALYPANLEERAISRSLCAELHSGFSHFREKCPFSLGAVKPLGLLDSNLSIELSRIDQIFSKAALPYMFSEAGAVDAFYSVLAYRLKIYGIDLKGNSGKY